MKKVTFKIPAKINITLDVLGVTDGFHDIKSLVASIDVFDTVTAVARKDNLLTLKLKGIPVDCDVVDNNAFKAGKLFIKKTGCSGADIFIDKKIPLGGGLGGSSADIAGVLKCMEALYKTGKKLTPMANELGSDSAYMLEGGFAVLTGRGDKIARKDIDKTLYLILIPEQKSTSARAVYKAYDKLEKVGKNSTLTAVHALQSGDMDKFYSVIKNDLTEGALTIVPEIYGNIYALKKAGAPAALMTGSGSCSYGIFATKKERDVAFNKLKKLYKNTLIKAQTIVPNKK